MQIVPANCNRRLPRALLGGHCRQMQSRQGILEGIPGRKPCLGGRRYPRLPVAEGPHRDPDRDA
eukprot:2967915-Lingulodinium_polyedra.AAC.1